MTLYIEDEPPVKDCMADMPVLVYCPKCKADTRRYAARRGNAYGDCAPCALKSHQKAKGARALKHSLWMKKNRKVQQIYQNARRHGLTVAQFNALLIVQQDRCAICRRQFTRTPHIDHDHSCCPDRFSCGACVRGLLCAGCNGHLGRCKDDAALLSRYVTYVETRRKEEFCQTSA